MSEFKKLGQAIGTAQGRGFLQDCHLMDRKQILSMQVARYANLLERAKNLEELGAALQDKIDFVTAADQTFYDSFPSAGREASAVSLSELRKVGELLLPLTESLLEDEPRVLN